MRFLPPPADLGPGIAIDIAARTDQLASQTALEHIGHALIANVWRAAQAPLALPGPDAMCELSAACMFKAKNLCASITTDAVEAELLRLRWAWVLWAVLPRFQPGEYSLAANALHKAQAPLALPGHGAMRELSAACVFKAKTLCASITADAIEAELLRLRWAWVLWAVLPRHQTDTRLADRFAAQSGILAEDIAIQSTALLLRKKLRVIQEYAVVPGDFVASERLPNILPEKIGDLPTPDTEDLLTPSL